MKKHIIIVSFIVIGLVMGGFAAPQMAGAWYHTCFVPNLIKGGAWGWSTGLHIVGNYSKSEEFKIRIFDRDGLYKEVFLDLADHHGGWTGDTTALLNLDEYAVVGKAPAAPPPPDPPVYPLRIYIFSTSGWFTVTQTYGNMYKSFGIDTHRSWPASKDSPYEDGTMTLSEPMGERMSADELEQLKE